eukprot:4948134-Amphidinium_carterae.1
MPEQWALANTRNLACKTAREKWSATGGPKLVVLSPQRMGPRFWEVPKIHADHFPSVARGGQKNK